MDGILTMSRKLLATYLAEEQILNLLKKKSLPLAIRSFAKWAPLVGTIVSVALGGGLMYGFGQKVIKDCDEVAEELLRLVVEAEKAAT